MRDIRLSPLERECWRERASSADYREIGSSLGVSGERAKYAPDFAKSFKEENEMSEPFKLDFAPANDRGFMRADFKDRNGDACSIQESSLATEECIWLGLNEGTHHHVTGDCLARMHLNREQAGELGRALLGFAKTGKLGESGEAAPQNLQIDARVALDYMDLTSDLLQSNRQYAQGFANLTEQLRGSLHAGVKLERENERLRELLRQSRHLYGRNGKESVELFEAWRRRVEVALAPAGKGGKSE
jgi:hypothetical protein